MITKELLSEVLTNTYGENFQIYEFEEAFTFEGYHFTYDYSDNNIEKDSINIYELAHKCKEWAFNNYGIDIKTSRRTFGFVAKLGIGTHTNGQQTADTEPEAIFKACQWILDNKEK